MVPDLAASVAGLAYRPNFLSRPEADTLLCVLLGELPWHQAQVKLFGRTQRQPRLICWMGDPGARYRYSGTTHTPSPWHAAVLNLRDRIAAHCDAPFNSVLINLYRTGQDSMGWHADNEPELGPEPLIASVSLGATRDFRLRRNDRSQPTITHALESGSLLVMKGDMQRDWQHSLPRRARVNQPRINLTFRQVTVPDEVSAA